MSASYREVPEEEGDAIYWSMILDLIAGKEPSSYEKMRARQRESGR